MKQVRGLYTQCAFVEMKSFRLNLISGENQPRGNQRKLFIRGFGPEQKIEDKNNLNKLFFLWVRLYKQKFFAYFVAGAI